MAELPRRCGAAYASVFIVQALGLLIAGVLLRWVDPNLFQQRLQRALGDRVALELD
ncbi:MAG: hypothetical protein VKJ87_02610 [Synechococcus sp.]|nr:hypothetical protein [Synechococcus sp.]